ncbi:DUF192 domain-containing protein [archaeon]|nr:DUF192 domain-containing protein [archaeon]
MLKWVTLSTFIVFFCFVATTWGYSSLPTIEIGLKDGTTVTAELAVTKHERQRGLMYRDGLRSGEGMLFVFNEEDRYPVWMKNVDFPIDIIWINSDFRVVDAQTAAPCTDYCRNYLPEYPAMYVLEVPSGFADAHGIETGSPVDISAYNG